MRKVESEVNSPRRERKSRKPFVLERRYVRPIPVDTGVLFDFMKTMREWHVCGKYRTERDRETAISSLSKKNESLKWEYRVAVD